MRKMGRGARAAFQGTVVTSNSELEQRPRLLNEDAFGRGWMLIVKPTTIDWREGLVTGAGIQAAFDDWLAAEAYKNRAE